MPYISYNAFILLLFFQDSNKTIQLNAFQVFQLFVANQNKPAEIVSILITNRGKLLRFFGDFKFDKVDEVFEADKAQVVKEIAMLEPTNNPCADLDKCDIPC
ncbi:putative MO25-like protein At5g47540 [Camellia sinensis]|uniref:putative MO25-like protein At5g47540 n=1 Tax=Camellia sinensis TaxID=4442 RepID=UPI001035A106|nr:putative MO25-like protein At5g47540 [Camellia sinensis]